MTSKEELVDLISKKVDVQRFQKHHWEGSFWDYL